MSDTRTRPTARIAALLAVALVFVLGLALISGARASGVSCSAGESSITVTWTGEARAFQYTAWVQNSSGNQSGKLLDWSERSSEPASTTISSLSAGTYTVWVNMETDDGTWINIGETSCTVTTSTVTATPTVTFHETPEVGSLACTTDSYRIFVQLNPEDGTTSWDVWAEHSLGNPRWGTTVLRDSLSGHLPTWVEFNQTAQGTWSVSGTATLDDGTESTLSTISCTVSGGL